MTPRVECVGAGVGRAPNWALREATLSVRAGEVIAILGGEGSGVAPLAGVLAGVTRIQRGRVSRVGVGRVGWPCDPPLFPAELSGLEWLQYVAGHRVSTPRRRLVEVRLAIELGGIHREVGWRLSAWPAERLPRLAIAAAFVGRPRLIVLPVGWIADRELVDRLRRRVLDPGAPALVVFGGTGGLEPVRRLVHRVLVMRAGRIVADGGVEDLLGGRVLELDFGGWAFSGGRVDLGAFRGARCTRHGALIPLTGGVTAEHVLGWCRAHGIPVGRSRVRSRRLEEIAGTPRGPGPV